MARLASFEVKTVVQIATGAKVMQPFLSSNATGQVERKPLDHIFIFTRPARGLGRDQGKWEKHFEGTAGVLKLSLLKPL